VLDTGPGGTAERVVPEHQTWRHDVSADPSLLAEVVWNPRSAPQASSWLSQVARIDVLARARGIRANAVSLVIPSLP
jgi:hypothetical protein